jgi:hypothetical protein
VWGCKFTPKKITYGFDERVANTVDSHPVSDPGDMSIWCPVIALPLGSTAAVDESGLPIYAVCDHVRYYAKK